MNVGSFMSHWLMMKKYERIALVRARSAASSLAPKPSDADLCTVSHKRPLYLCAGHVTRDLDGSGWSFGGPVYFSSCTAAALGCEVVAITRMSGSDLALLKQKVPGTEWLSRPAGISTTVSYTHLTLPTILLV